MAIKKLLFPFLYFLFFGVSAVAQKGLIIQGGGFISEKGGGFNAMAGLDFQLDKYLYLRPQIGLSEKKYLKFGAFPKSTGETFSLYSNYLEFNLPVIGKLDFQKWRLLLIAGAAAGYAVRLEGRQLYIEDGLWVEEKFSLSRWNAEIFYGGGLELPVAEDNFITLSVTRHIGLCDINLSPGADFYHQGLSIMMGLNLPFGKN
ncbi:MAG TPA: hypothetical protein PKC40_14010 [Saprospiraceae bacterium]|nr:hypothetical protein [Saprospiraceae bacterium]